MTTLAVRNQNPGNLRSPDGGFQKFADPVDGKAALYNDLTAKMTGQSKTGLTPQSTLLEFAKVYAPPSDKNDSVQYAANLANKLGVSPDTQIGTLTGRIDDFAHAIASNEDPSGDKLMSSGYVDTADGSTDSKKSSGYVDSVDIPNLPQNQTDTTTQPQESQLTGKDNPVGSLPVIKQATQFGTGVGSAIGKGGLELGKLALLASRPIANLMGYGAENKEASGKIDEIKDKIFNEPNKQDLKSVAGKIGQGVGYAAPLAEGLLPSLAKKAALKSPVVVKALESALGKGETISNLTRQEAINTLGNTLKEMPIEEVGGKSEQMILKALKELNPTLAEKQSFIARYGKTALNGIKYAALAKVFGDSIGGLIHKITN